MPRTVDYPWASLKRALDAAQAVDYLGGKASLDMCAEQMGMRIGGGFKTIVSSATKFDLLQSNKGALATTELYKLIKYSYTEEERTQHYKQAFLSAPIFLDIYERFKGKKLPVELLDKLLIREFQVEPSVASRVAGYFTEGAKFVGILDDNNQLIERNNHTAVNDNSEEIELVEPERHENNYHKEVPTPATLTFVSEEDDYIVHIKGPDIDTKILIKEGEDIEIINLTLNKIKRKLLS